MEIKIVCQNDNVRITEELKLHITRKLYKNIKSTNSKIFVNGIEKKSFEIINKGDIITINYEKEKEINWDLYESKLDIRYESDNYLVVYKPHGLLSIPTMAEPKSIYQEVLYYLKNTNQPLTVSILNRLDKDTSGLMVIAKNRIAANYLQPTHEKMERRYHALVHGILEGSGTINKNITKSEDSNIRYISDDGKTAITHYKAIRQYNDYTLVEYILETGRTHQIRVHSKSINHPLCGDKMYGIEDNFDTLQLSSIYVKFTDLFTNQVVEIKSDNDFNLEVLK